MFTFNIKLTDNKFVECRELPNKLYVPFVKSIMNNDNIIISNFIDRIIEYTVIDKNQIKELNCIDKFLILLDLRSISISNSITINTGQLFNNTNVEIDKLCVHILESLPIITEQVFIDDLIKIRINIPRDISYEFTNIANTIQSIEIDKDLIQMNQVTSKIRESILNFIPAKLFNQIINFINITTKSLEHINIITANTKLNINKVEFNIFNNTLFEFIKAIYNENLLNVYKMQYILMSKLNYDNDTYLNLTPNESQLHLNFYNEELKQQQDEYNKNSKASSKTH
tara:strand:- start:4618 stop:5469 length:852 start_codon:yes stop_codon:yes gene_type:complete